MEEIKIARRELHTRLHSAGHVVDMAVTALGFNGTPGKPTRVVMYGDFGVPCGGTHVQNLAEIKHLIIRKLKAKGPNIQVAYDISR